MNIYLFETKKASSSFVKSFSSRFNPTVFHSKENSTARGKGAERFNDFSWPTWDGEIPQNTAAVFQGLVRGTKEVYNSCMAAGRDWYYFDQPYFFSNDYQQSNTGDRWYRIIKNNTQKNHIEKNARVNKRFDLLTERLNDKCKEELTPKPWQYEGKHILIIPPSYHTARWYDIDHGDWTNDIVKKIKQYSNREVRVRHKFKDSQDWSPDRNEIPLNEDLINCHAMVSFHSMSAVHAVMAGVPSFCSEHSPAFPVSLGLKEIDQINDPLYSGERQDWVKSLMCAQFTDEEMMNGKAYFHLNGENRW